jgi:hypothetical protein
MGRVVLRRDALEAWSDISAPWPSIQEGVIGFTGIAGAHPSLLYAVGWKGEIWVRTDGKWSKEDCPTNANLNGLALLPDATVVIVGDNGTVLRGRRGLWEMIDLGTDKDFTDVCIHTGEVYLSTNYEVYRLVGDTLIPDLVAEGDESLSCLKLIPSRGSLLYSMGTSDVFFRCPEGWRRLA